MSGELRATPSANDYIGYTVADIVTENAKLYAALQASTELLRGMLLSPQNLKAWENTVRTQLAANEAALGGVK